jgi:hypothetical protein
MIYDDEGDEHKKHGLRYGSSAYRDYASGEPLSYWRSTSGFEVDFIIGDHTAVEVKAKDRFHGKGTH